MRGKVNIVTLSPIKILGEMQKNKIRVYRLKITKKGLSFLFLSKDKKQLRAVLDMINVVYEIKKAGGKTGAVETFFARIGIFGCIAATIICAVIASFFVVDVRVIGNDEAQNLEICREIKQRFIGKGATKDSLNLDEINAFVENGFEKVALTSSRFFGSCVEIVVISQKENTPIFGALEIKSQYDAVVSRVLLMSGTSLVGAGDRVLRGDKLIEGKFSYDDNIYDEIPPVQHAVEPKGEIYGRVWYKKTIAVPVVERTFIPTGRSITKRVLGIGNNVNLTPPATDFATKQTTIKKQTISGFFPMDIYTITVFETQLKEVSTPFEQRKAAAIFAAKQELSLELPKGGKSIAEWNVVRAIAGVEYIDIYCEVEQRIDIVQ